MHQGEVQGEELREKRKLKEGKSKKEKHKATPESENDKQVMNKKWKGESPDKNGSSKLSGWMSSLEAQRGGQPKGVVRERIGVEAQRRG